MVDGKTIALQDLEAYRSGMSTRTRGRKRGGSQIRAKESLVALLRVLCIYICNKVSRFRFPGQRIDFMIQPRRDLRS